ncbi:MAG: phosphonate C-P lyase system protein PhnL [Candidatus Eiseniibacteriota bacterium]
MNEAAETMIVVEKLRKRFTLHVQGGVIVPVFDGIDLAVARGECVVLGGPSGAGKSTLLRAVYGNYLPQGGTIRVRDRDGWVTVTGAEPRTILALRRRTLGYVSQFLRVIPRVPTLDLVMAPLVEAGVAPGSARERAAALLDRLNVPARLWPLPPATFSGGEQQRVNIARTFIVDYPILLLDEPTASLDAGNRQVVVELVEAARSRGAAILGIVHDAEVRQAIGTRIFDIERAKAAA